MNEDVILCNSFKLGPKFRTIYKTSLTNKEVFYESNLDVKYSHRIALEDVIGAKIVTRNDDEVLIYIYSYPLVKKKLSRKLKRQRIEHIFCVQSSETNDGQRQSKSLPAENDTTIIKKRVAEKWVNSIRQIINDGFIHEGEPSQLRFVVFVNPFGGLGSALKTFNKKVKPMLIEAHVDYELKVTKYAGHAREIVQSLDVANLDCVICCSGDGLLFEVVNGLMSRPDWKEAIQTPLGHIPCGSGNGLCASALHHSKEVFNMISSVFTIIRGSPQPLDIVRTETASSAIHYSFLGLVYGLIADVDIESEKYRHMGDLRFTMMALWKIAKRQCSMGKMWYLPLDDNRHRDHPSEQGASDVDNGYSTSHQPGGEVDTSLSNITIRGELSANGIEGASNKLSNVDQNHTKSYQPGDEMGTNVGDELLEDGIESSCRNVTKNGTSTSYHGNKYLPKAVEPIPATWKCIEGNFVGWLFVTLSHIGKGAYVVPGAELGDGVIHCAYFTDDITRRDLLDIMGKIENGEYVDVRGVHMVQAKAFRFEPSPSSPCKNMTIDGELVEFGPIQGEVHKGLGRVRCR